MRRTLRTLDGLSRSASYGLLWIGLLALIGLLVGGCHPRRVVVVPARPLAHDIGLWLDDDLICVGLTPREALYVTRRCVPMRTIRAVILQTQVAVHSGEVGF